MPHLITSVIEGAYFGSNPSTPFIHPTRPIKTTLFVLLSTLMAFLTIPIMQVNQHCGVRQLPDLFWLTATVMIDRSPDLIDFSVIDGLPGLFWWSVSLPGSPRSPDNSLGCPCEGALSPVCNWLNLDCVVSIEINTPESAHLLDIDLTPRKTLYKNSASNYTLKQ